MYKVLIVDDEYDIRTNLARFLPWGEHGFLVAGQASNGVEAKDFTEANSVDVVFCDIQMPLMGGLEFARWAKENCKTFVVVFLSAYRKFEFAQEALRYGVRRYLVKPPNLAEFEAALDAIREELHERRLASGCKPCTGADDPVVLTVKAYIAGDPAAATIEGAALLVSMSSHYLSTLFKEKTGETFSALLLRTKMEQAAALLREGTRSACEVSRMVGYANQKNFSRAFGAYFGRPPRDFRRPAPEQRDSEG